MKTIDLNWSIKDLDEKEIDNAKANKLFAGSLMAEKNGDPVKYFDWAMTLNKTGIIEVDDADFDKLKEVVKSSESLAMLSKAQYLKYFATVK